ncbi:MAG: nucleoside kinase [Lachnospiraceae bacterium]|jgi:uridine kinase|nr:nucleoside kinase [Lachnospiraceae bacterium]
MAKEFINITYRGITKKYEEGIRILDIANEYQKDFSAEIALALVNGRMKELNKKMWKDGEIEFITVEDKNGREAYRRSVEFILLKAIYDVADRSKIEKVINHFSLGEGLYFTIKGDIKVNQEFLDKVQVRMKEITDKNLTIEKNSLGTEDAIERFEKYGMYDKAELFKYRRVSRVNVYKVGDFEDYFYGQMMANTGSLTGYKLYLYDEGFILEFPSSRWDAATKFANESSTSKFFNVLKESTKWAEGQNLETVSDLNDVIVKGKALDMILIQEARHNKKIADMAEYISKNPHIKFVLIAGPSSSGKTTFSRRLSIQLKANGLNPYPISVDNFFKEREETPKNSDGTYDFECLEALDLDLFNKDMEKLLNGEDVVIPTFDFVEGKKKYEKPPIHLEESDILVIEGIHSLNPKFSASLPEENKYKIYVSALTQLNIDEHNRIPTTDGRLLRRILRDERTRGIDAKGTIEMWNSVRKGEIKNIFPYQEEADIQFNSNLIYEFAVLKPKVEPVLYAVPRGSDSFFETRRLLKFLDYFVCLDDEDIPKNSILREFIGGGCFDI